MTLRAAWPFASPNRGEGKEIDSRSFDFRDEYRQEGIRDESSRRIAA
jgi:hypothetical protein